jgi:hypothetical protein
MYHLAILVDNRKYQIVQLQSATVVYTRTPAPSFVLEQATGQTRLLLSIAHEAPFILYGGYKGDRPIDWSSVQLAQTPEGVRLQLRALESNASLDQPTPATAMEGPFRVQHEQNRCQLLIKQGFYSEARETTLSVTLSVVIDELEYVGTLLFHIVPKAQIFDVVMDFGSEASQVVTSQRGGSDILYRMNLVDTLIEYYYQNLAGQDLHQRTGTTTDDAELYRSAFFIRKEGAVFFPEQPPGKHGNDELLNLLTAKQDINRLIQERELISNLKLAHLGAYHFEVQFADITSNAFGVQQKNILNTLIELQQAVVNYFLQAVLKKIYRNTPDVPVYVVVKLLMPNVFEQKKTARMVAGTAAGLQQMVADAATKLSGYEISTISESDAAFLGFKREKEKALRTGQPSFFETDGRYLIIDAGKGTTDFSIIQFGENAQLTSLYRSGFIGAGNVLSYAFIDSVFASICGPNAEARQRAIFAVMQRAGIADRLQFTEIIERLKRDYNPNARYRPLGEVVDLSTVKRQVEDPNEPGTLEAITALLEQVANTQKSIADESNIISQTVVDAARRIYDEVYNSGLFFDIDTRKPLIKKIILTGRGFLFGALQTAISSLFGEFGLETVRAGDLKKVCLSGAFSTDHINHESNLTGYPDLQMLFGNPGAQIRQIDKGDGVIILVPTLSRFKSLDRVLDTVRPFLDKAWRELNKFKEAANDEFLVSATQAQHRPPVQSDVLGAEERFLIKGRNFPHFNRHKQTVTICGIDYKQHDINSSVVNIFYTGETFIIRDANTCSELSVAPEFFQRTHWVFRTLFPFSAMAKPGDVQVTMLETDAF